MIQIYILRFTTPNRQNESQIHQLLFHNMITGNNSVTVQLPDHAGLLKNDYVLEVMVNNPSFSLNSNDRTTDTD